MVPRIVKQLATATGEAVSCLTNCLPTFVAGCVSFDLQFAIMAL